MINKIQGNKALIAISKQERAIFAMEVTRQLIRKGYYGVALKSALTANKLLRDSGLLDEPKVMDWFPR